MKPRKYHNLIIALCFLLSSSIAMGQITIAVQDFESTPATPTYNYSNSGGSTSSGNGDYPTDPMYSDGSQGYQFNNETGSLTFNTTDVSAYSNIELSFRLASFAGTSANGADGTDYVQVLISTDGGANYSNEIKVKGNNNSKWSFTSGTGTATTAYDGDNTATSFAPAAGGNRTTDGYSTVKVTGIPNSSNLIVKIEVKNNSGNEYWVIDEVLLTGTNPYDGDSKAESPVSQVSAVSIASTVQSPASAVDVFKFKISDLATADTVDTKVSRIRIKKYSGSQLLDNWIAGFVLKDGASTISIASVYEDPSAAYFDLNFNSGDLSIASGTSKELTLAIYLASSVDDNATFSFYIDADDNGFTAFSTGSGFDSDFGTDVVSNTITITVTADRLSFTSAKPPTTVYQNTDFNVEVKATDASGNIDLDATSSVSLAVNTGTGTLSSASGLSQNLVSGVASWTDVQYNTVEDFKIEAQNASLTNGVSSLITCATAGGTTLMAWINEFHYDNAGTDANEVVEVCIVNAKTYNLSDFTLTLYNGSTGASYDSKTLDLFAQGTVYDSVYTYTYNFSNGGSLQNGAPDGIALSYDDGSKAVNLIEFISYEGDFTAVGGPADGVLSQDVGVTEGSSTTSTESIGRVGINDQFLWESGNSSSWGAKNNKSGGDYQVLPVELLSFSAKIIGNTVNLKWQTASETNNHYFSIERSMDAQNFEEIGRVAGAGNSNTIRDYSYTDNIKGSSTPMYYRLKQLDYNGAFSYSNILSIKIDPEHFIINEMHQEYGYLNMNLFSQEATSIVIEVYDLSGHLLVHKSFEIMKHYNKIKLDVSKLSYSTYILRVSDKDFIVTKKLLIK